MPKALSSVPVWRVSSAATRSAPASVSRARAAQIAQIADRCRHDVQATRCRVCHYTSRLAQASGETAMQGMAAVSRRPRLRARRGRFGALTSASCRPAAWSSPMSPPPDSAQSARSASPRPASMPTRPTRTPGSAAQSARGSRQLRAAVSAEQWVLADNVPSRPSRPTRRSPARPRAPRPASRALVAAEIALAERDGAAAIHELDSIPVPTSAAARAELLVAARQGRVPHRASGRGHARLRRARALHADRPGPAAQAARSCSG